MMAASVPPPAAVFLSEVPKANRAEASIKKLTSNAYAVTREKIGEKSLPTATTEETTIVLELQQHPLEFDRRSTVYTPLLQECIDRRSASGTRIIHGRIVKDGATGEELLLSTAALVNGYAKCGAMGDARKLFEKSPHRNTTMWMALIAGYAHCSQPENAIRVFLQLLESGAYPINYTLGVALTVCASLRAYSYYRLGLQIHGYAVKYGAAADTSVGNSLCSFYSRCERLHCASKVFRSTQGRNVFSWTTMISACSDNGHPALGLRTFSEMLAEGVVPNEFTLTSAMSLCCASRAVVIGKQVHSTCVRLGFDSSLPVRNSIMYMYLKCGLVDEARVLVPDVIVEAGNLITWNAMVAGYAQLMAAATDDLSARSRGMEALEIFLKLNRSGSMRPDLYTFSSVLTVCSAMAASEQGEQIHAQVIKTGYLSDVIVATALVNMYNKCGAIEDASRAFVEMPTRTLISWTSMMAGYSQQGRPEEAVLLFEDMRMAGVRPNQVTFVAILSACSGAGWVEEALHYYKMMQDEYGIKPVMDHCSCMVDLFMRLGRLEETFDFIKTMPFEPNEALWSAVITGCRCHGDMGLAFYAGDRLLELRPARAETFVMLLSMYISTERWQDVSRVKKLMEEKKLENLRDWSWMSIKGNIYYFRADDTSCSQAVEIYKLLAKLLDEAKCLGYVAHKSLEISEEELEDKDDKETWSCSIHHSEKLAIAFGLLNTVGRAPIRIIKNISMCRDCHSAVKYFSLSTRREIIIRDSKRLHRFRDGRCSCGDFATFI